MLCQNHLRPLSLGYALQLLKFCKNSTVKFKKIQNYTYNLAVALGKLMDHHRRGSDSVNLSEGRFFM